MLHYAISGNINSRPLVFLHGALVSSGMWKDQSVFFRDRYRVITIDLPGHGGSDDLEGDYSVEAVAMAVADTIERMKLGPVFLVGHSLGGMVAQEAALQIPDLAAKLVLAETSYGTGDTLINRTGSALAAAYLRITSQEQLVRLSVKTYGKNSPRTMEYIQSEMKRYDISQSRRVMAAALNYSSADRLHEIRCPVLIMAAEQNRQTVKQAGLMNSLIVGSEKVIVPGANHMLNMDNPDFFNRTAEVFFDKPG